MPTALIGGAVSAVGGLLSANAQKKAAAKAAAGAQFNPFNISGAGGSVNFQDGAASVQADARTQQFQNAFGSQFQTLAGQAGQGQQLVQNQLGGFFDQAGVAGDPSSAVNAANIFSNFSAQNAQFGQQGGQQAFGLASQFGQAQGGRNEGLAQNLFGFGQQALANTDFSSLAADQLARSRALARPGEDRAVNAKFQNLFGRGILSSTSGARQLGELGLTQELADINRVGQSEQFANQLGQQNRQFGLAAFGQGQGFRAQDDQFNLSRAGLFGNVGQGLLNFGQQAGQQGLQAQFGASNLVNTRGQQRLSNASSLFGFGQQANQQNFQQQLGLFGANRGINQDLRQLIALGGNLGSSQATAGAAAGQFTTQGGISPFGSFLGGAGETIAGI